jgi:hypothetical protein
MGHWDRVDRPLAYGVAERLSGRDEVSMSKTKKSAEPETFAIINPASGKGGLKAVGGSMSDDWNSVLMEQTIGSIWYGSNPKAERINTSRQAAATAMIGIAPKDEIEGMVAAQLVACHNATMECYRRAMLPEQTHVSWNDNLNHASKLSRTYAALLETLNRHRGKGQQKVTVEHVHVHEGGQAIVGNVETPGGGFASKSKGQPHALAHAPGTPMPSADPLRGPVSVARDEERPMPDARRNVTGRAEGE